jgi:hypothetical protein
LNKPQFDIVIRPAYDGVSNPFERYGALMVTFMLPIMNRAVYLQHEATLDAAKISDKLTNWVLPPKLVAA